MDDRGLNANVKADATVNGTGNVTVTVNLPGEILQLARDFHADREQIGMGFGILLLLLAVHVFRNLFRQ
jgi:hypothetical protein